MSLPTPVHLFSVVRDLGYRISLVLMAAISSWEEFARKVLMVMESGKMLCRRSLKDWRIILWKSFENRLMSWFSQSFAPMLARRVVETSDHSDLLTSLMSRCSSLYTCFACVMLLHVAVSLLESRLLGG